MRRKNLCAPFFYNATGNIAFHFTQQGQPLIGGVFGARLPAYAFPCQLYRSKPLCYHSFRMTRGQCD